MNKYEIIFIGYLFLWTICILDTRMTVCRHPYLWSFITTTTGILVVVAGALANCYLGYEAGLTTLKYDRKIIMETLLLQTTTANEKLFFWLAASLGNSIFISGLEILAICGLLKKGIIPRKELKVNHTN